MAKIGRLEQHVVNLIMPIQGITQVLRNTTDIHQLIEALQKPIPVDAVKLHVRLDEFQRELRKFDKSLEKMGELVSETSSAEIKFLAKKMTEIEKILNDLLKTGIKKEVKLEFSCDGYELVKKSIGYDENEPIEQPTDILLEVLNSLPIKQQAKSLCHRYGLLGEKKKTLDGVGQELNVSRERARQIIARAIRLLRHPTRIEKVRLIKHDALRRDIIGE